jgi:hypothetical protein
MLFSATGRNDPRVERAFRFKDGSLYCEGEGCGKRERAGFTESARDEEAMRG